MYIHCVVNLNMAKEKVINFRIDGDLKIEAKKLAKSQGRTLSNWISWLIEQEVIRAAGTVDSSLSKKERQSQEE